LAKHALLGNKLRALRRRQGLTQVEMAAQLGISPSYLNLIEHNQRALTLALLLKLAEAYDVDMQAFSGTEEARLLADLTELFGDPVLREHEIGRQALSELVGTVPEVTRAIFSLYRAYRNAREDVLGLTERLADNPYLSVACHRLLTFLTSIRSCSEILQDNLDLPLERRRHFVDILVRESENLTELANELFDFFAGHGLRELRGAGAPADEVTDVLHARGNYFPGLEAAAQSMREEIGLGPANAVDTLAARLASAHGHPGGKAGLGTWRHRRDRAGRWRRLGVAPLRRARAAPGPLRGVAAQQHGLSACPPTRQSGLRAGARGAGRRGRAREPGGPEHVLRGAGKLFRRGPAHAL
jgi:transcriptional regulator with XRE-family HTH domain